MSFFTLQSKLAAIVTQDELLQRQVRICSIFLKSESDCRENVRAFRAFALKVGEWLDEVASSGQVSDAAALSAFREFVASWVAFSFS